MKETSKGFRHLLAASRNTISGLGMMMKETAFRQELLLGVAHFSLMYVLRLPLWPALLLTALWVLVIVVEMLNTAIEAVVDLVSPGYHELAKRAKDIASAAVGTSLVAFFAVWTIVLSNR